MTPYIDLAGKRFGKLTVLSRNGSYKCGRSSAAMWLCKCDCGCTKTIIGQSLRNGTTKSCGCLIGKSIITHGLTKTPSHRSWSQMKSRCYNINHHAYSSYGGRGISVCKRWKNSFENFYEDIGERPSLKCTLNRIDNNGNYSPDNCHWATKKEQARNRKDNKLITYKGETLCAIEWSERIGSHSNIVSRRIHSGWTPERAITTPIMIKYRRN